MVRLQECRLCRICTGRFRQLRLRRCISESTTTNRTRDITTPNTVHTISKDTNSKDNSDANTETGDRDNILMAPSLETSLGNNHTDKTTEPRNKKRQSRFCCKKTSKKDQPSECIDDVSESLVQKLRIDSPSPLRMSSRSETPSRKLKRREIIYKECVVIGNGPSAISLSYFLNGNRPYYNGEPLSNEYVQARLEDDINLSIIDQDLEYLTDGVEGRSHNPVAVLYDMLTHPGADMGLANQSALRWTRDQEKIDHVVLGKGKPGGVWQRLEGSGSTLSLGTWMELPNLPFKQWLQTHGNENTCTNCDHARAINDRATIADVRQYYADYVRQQNLTDNFLNDHWVTSVQKVVTRQTEEIDCESGECCVKRRCKCDIVWEVCGKKRIGDLDDDIEDFCFRTKNVVLATGTHDQPNRLHVPGENLPYVMHSLQELHQAIDNGALNTESNPIVIIGAGLSVGDAIVAAEKSNLDIAHVFRRNGNDPDLVFRNLSSVQYPEYHQVYDLIRGKASCDYYVPYDEHVIGEFLPDGQVMIHDKNDPLRPPKIIQASAALVLIGSKPDLSFMPHEGRKLGLYPSRRIESKTNPLSIDPYTYESIVEPGLFGMGALVGDNFVRFLQGGGLAICKRLIARRKENKGFVCKMKMTDELIQQ